MPELLKSRKFWLAIFNFVIGAALLIVGQFWPQYDAFAKQLVVLITALFVSLIGGIAIEDAGQKASGVSWKEKAEANAYKKDKN